MSVSANINAMERKGSNMSQVMKRGRHSTNLGDPMFWLDALMSMREPNACGYAQQLGLCIRRRFDHLATASEARARCSETRHVVRPMKESTSSFPPHD